MLSTKMSGPSLERHVSTFRLGDLNGHPLIQQLPKAQREIVIANVAAADVNGDGELNLDEYLTSRECYLVIRGLLPVQLTKAPSLSQ